MASTDEANADESNANESNANEANANESAAGDGESNANIMIRITEERERAAKSQILYVPETHGELRGAGQSSTKEFLKWAANGIVSKVAGTAIGGPILDLFGLGDKDYEKYLKQIQSQLADISSELNKGMTVLQQGISEIKSAITALTIESRDQKLQDALRAYNQSKNKITQNFSSFANAIAGSASKDTATSVRSIKSIYDLLAITNMNSVSEALLNIHDGLYGAGQMTGIIEYEVDACYNAAAKWASDPGNLRSGGHDPYQYVDYSRILFESGSVMCKELSDSVLPNLKAMLTAQLQGIALLAHAWAGTEQEPQLKVHTGHMLAQITKIRGLYSAMTATAKYNKFVQDLITATAKPMPQEVYNEYAENLDQPTGDLGKDGLRYWRRAKPPFGIDWVAWGHPRYYLPNIRVPYSKPWDGEEPTMMDGYPQACFLMCVIKSPINYGGINQIIHIGTIYGEKAPFHFYTGVKGEIRKSGTPRRLIYDPRNTPIPYPHSYIPAAPKEFADFVKELESPPT